MLSTRIDAGAHGARELRRQLYLVSLALVVPAALVTIQSGFPTPGFMRYFTLGITGGWALLLLGLLLRVVSHRVVEWGTYLLGAVVFYVVMLSTLLRWDGAQALAVLGAASLLPPWAFLSFRDKLGLRVSVTFYLLMLFTWCFFAVPAWFEGTYEASHLAEAWRVYVYYFALSPVYIALTAAMAILNRYQSRQRLKAMTEFAYQDALTGLPNRRAFQESLEHSVQEGVQSGVGGTLVLLNINEFTRLNNELGHTAGDEALRVLAGRWQGKIMPGAHFSRMNGDEFGLVLPTAEPDVVQQQVRALLTGAQAPVNLSGALRNLHVRVGVVTFPKHGETATQVNSAADVAQAEARRQAQQVVVYNAALAERAERRRVILSALPQAIPAGAFQLVYQPILHLGSGQVHSVETLLRWNSGLTPNPTPDEFIPLAEEARLIEPLGRWVLSTALQQMHTWREAGVPVPRVNVNVAPQELLRAGYASRVLKQLNELNLPTNALELELTERTVLKSAAVTELRVLRQAGVHVAIDDFGTGHSSLAWLHSLPITCVKIDRRFTGMLGQDGAADRLARTVLNLANSMNLEVVAEGVETPAQLNLLQALNCPLGQGYLFSRALPPQEFETFLHQHQSAPLPFH